MGFLVPSKKGENKDLVLVEEKWQRPSMFKNNLAGFFCKSPSHQAISTLILNSAKYH
jgi:hypothetical protein